MILDHGFWAGLTLYPQTKVSPQRAVDMHREVRPGSDPRGRRLRLGPERAGRGAEVRDGDAAAQALRGAHPACRARESRSGSSSQSAEVPGAGRRRGRQPDEHRLTGRASCRSRAGRFAPPHLLHQHPRRPTAGRRSLPQPRPLRTGAQGALLAGRARSASACGCRRATHASCSTDAVSTSFRAFLDRRWAVRRHHQRLSVRPVPPVRRSKPTSTRRTGATRTRVRYTLRSDRHPRRASARRRRRRRVHRAALLQGLDARASTGTIGDTITRTSCGVAETLVRVRRERGAFIHLDIEPEPDCVLENTDETIAFFERLAVASTARRLAGRRRSASTPDRGAPGCSPTTSGSASTAATSRSSTRIRASRSTRSRAAGIGSAASS